MGNKNYLLVTTIKNEEKNLKGLFDSIIFQIKKPLIWLIINDGSTDKSLELLNNYSRSIPFIKIVSFDINKRDLEFRYHYNIKWGIDYVMTLANENNFQYDYVGVLDGDIELEENYFFDIINEFQKDCQLGVCSGTVKAFNGTRYVVENRKTDSPCGAARLIKKELLLKVGWAHEPAADGILLIKAKLLGYSTKQFGHIFVYQKRLTGQGINSFENMIYKGKITYYLGYTFPYALWYFFKSSFKSPYFHSLVFIFVYSYKYFCSHPRILDQDVINYKKDVFKRSSILSCKKMI